MSDSLGDLQKVRLPTVEVLRALLAAARPVYGFEIIRATDLSTMTVYSILTKLRRLGWITSEREAVNVVVHRTPREFHQLTAGGATKALAVVDQWRARHGDDGLSDVDRRAA